MNVYTIDRQLGYLYPVPGSPFLTSAPVFFTAVHPSGKFVYALQTASPCKGGVVAFLVNADGSLSQVAGSPFPTQACPAGMVIDPSGKYLYAVDYTANALDAFAIDESTGELTPLAGSPYTVTVPGCANPAPSYISESGSRWLYVADALSDTVTGYAVESSTGNLTQLPGSPYLDSGGCTVPNVGDNPFSLSVTPDGKFLYAGNRQNMTISIYGIAPDGSLRLVKNTAPQFGDYCAGDPVPVDPSGKFLYTFGESVPGAGCNVFLHTQNELVGFTIDPSTGDLNPVPGSPFKVPENLRDVASPNGLTITP